MKQAKPFFYRLNAADIFAETREMNDKEAGKWLKIFISDLIAGNSKNEFTIAMIAETQKYRESKSLSGKKGMEKRWEK